MAPIKFEEHVKEKLEKREIQPSAGSWDKLDSRLNNSKKGSGKKWWISAVAAVAVLLIASMLFIDKQDQSSIPIVETPSEKTVHDNSENNASEKVIQVTSEETKERIAPETKTSNKDSESNRLSPKIIESDKAENLASNEPKERGLVEQVFIAPPSENQDLNSDYSGEISQLLAKISQKEQKSGSITEAEVDALLAEAAKKISEERNLFAQGKISAADLLADVEFEVDQSFRKEVFDFLKEEFLKAKTAVATRND